MLRIALIAGLLGLAAAPAGAQVQVTALAAPDAFSASGRDTGLPAELWRGTPIELARTVLPVLAARPLSPAAAALARRVLATGAPGPEGSGADPALVGMRANALIALGDLTAAGAILERQAGLDRAPELARPVAERALLSGDNAKACATAEDLSVGRAEVYWLRLRAFCEAEAGKKDQAQLTLDLAQGQARDPIYGRLMAAKLTGAAPGAASLRNGLDYALSNSLGLDLGAAKPAPAVEAASRPDPTPPTFDVSAIDGAIGGLGAALQAGPPPAAGVSALIAAAAEADARTRARLQGATLLVAALLPELTGPDRTRIAGFAVPEGKGPAGRSLSLAAAGEGKRMGEAALLVLWTSAEAGPAGLALGDRVRIVHALAQVGLDADARAFALEGLEALK
ncbi:hypothetical protein [Phenylobacterium sp.]|uniref:hypothetical protein n=1 Tax=Phenylobacterium sp. TaxID=1871053 RepID=UPI0025D609F8|nr:hypothetical protein [Phenylobacterium sp.]